MVIADASGLPVPCTRILVHHEAKPVQATLNEIVTMGRPRRIIGDRDYDSDPLDEALACQGIELIAPHRKNRKKGATQDGGAYEGINEGGKLNAFLRGLTNIKRQ